MSLIFIFLDGVGLAPAGPDNPLSDVATPVLRALLGGPLTIEQAGGGGIGDGGWKMSPTPHPPSPMLMKPIDATLGIPGLPQSGTGQTALLAGVNAAALHGRHQPHFPPVALRPLLAERNVLRRVVERGGRATFANAFGPGYWAAVAARRIRRSASVIAAEGAGLRFRDMDDLRAGQAVAWDVTGAALREREPAIDLPPITSQLAGINLARLADDHDLVFYESFLPDLAGHGRLTTDDRRPTTDKGGGAPSARVQIELAMNRLDGLIGGVLETLRSQDSLLITSDHGNIESYAAPAHTRNSVPLLVVGPAARVFGQVASIMDVAEAILSIFDFRY
ncbi:MAG TPA: metalloenzyme [Roseiflexaceae bacterium]|nr:metalloenzyme [Roseiflexaceae bacterium]